MHKFGIGSNYQHMLPVYSIPISQHLARSLAANTVPLTISRMLLLPPFPSVHANIGIESWSLGSRSTRTRGPSCSRRISPSICARWPWRTCRSSLCESTQDLGRQIASHIPMAASPSSILISTSIFRKGASMSVGVRTSVRTRRMGLHAGLCSRTRSRMGGPSFDRR